MRSRYRAYVAIEIVQVCLDLSYLSPAHVVKAGPMYHHKSNTIKCYRQSALGVKLHTVVYSSPVIMVIAYVGLEPLPKRLKVRPGITSGNS